jgi:hypothetical protein
MKATQTGPCSAVAALAVLLLTGQATTRANAQALTAPPPTPGATGPSHFMPTKVTSVRPLASTQSVITGPLINHYQGMYPVLTHPVVYVVYWGWTSDPYAEQAYLENFLSTVGGTPWLNTVVQYSYAGYSTDYFASSWSDPSPVPDHPTDAQIQSEVAAAVSTFGLYSSDEGIDYNNVIIVATPTGHSTAGFGVPGGFCAYHGGTADPATGTNVSYINLPYMPDAGGACGENFVNGPLDGVSIVAGHELAEALTDPLLSSWFDASGYEVADKCAWTNLANITTALGTFAVQPLWSNYANSCVLSTVPTVLP